MKQLVGNALKAEKSGWELVGWGDICFSLKNISSFLIGIHDDGVKHHIHKGVFILRKDIKGQQEKRLY